MSSHVPSRPWNITMILDTERGAVVVLVSRGRPRQQQQQPWNLRIYCGSPMVKFPIHRCPRRSWKQSIHRLIDFKGVELHKLVIGSKLDSTPLSTVCTQTHHFVFHYESMLLPQKRQQQNITQQQQQQYTHNHHHDL